MMLDNPVRNAYWAANNRGQRGNSEDEPRKRASTKKPRKRQEGAIRDLFHCGTFSIASLAVES
ncbi:hypothetical protein BCO37747_07648 [Burkholderia contaminans]|uniref:Uncharacterized protein n=1 Tax=Burkholderia aenigmatica TaxID=2015348 RepID=A0A6J5JU38_9BURK|nr:hypothetical protein BLA3211_08347 [Burkholderia aenigmatica]VWD63325.1 hypothetical protein BCO37747_07648 [Burkholderia contaminans]